MRGTAVVSSEGRELSSGEIDERIIEVCSAPKWIEVGDDFGAAGSMGGVRPIEGNDRATVIEAASMLIEVIVGRPDRSRSGGRRVNPRGRRSAMGGQIGSGAA